MILFMHDGFSDFSHALIDEDESVLIQYVFAYFLCFGS